MAWLSEKTFAMLHPIAAQSVGWAKTPGTGAGAGRATHHADSVCFFSRGRSRHTRHRSSRSRVERSCARRRSRASQRSPLTPPSLFSSRVLGFVSAGEVQRQVPLQLPRPPHRGLLLQGCRQPCRLCRHRRLRHVPLLYHGQGLVHGSVSCVPRSAHVATRSTPDALPRSRVKYRCVIDETITA